MNRNWNGLFVIGVVLQLPLIGHAGWGIYDPVTNQQVSKFGGPKTCSGIADVPGLIKVRLYSPTGVQQDSAGGTAVAVGTNWYWWSAVLASNYNWSVDAYNTRHILILFDSADVFQHQTNPQIID